jgi:hypothetical protein
LKAEDDKKEPSADLVATSTVLSNPSEAEVAARGKPEEQNAFGSGAPAEENSDRSRAAALSEVTNGANEPASSIRVPEPGAKPSESSAIASATSSAVTEEKGEEPRGLWGGFWKRRIDN